MNGRQILWSQTLSGFVTSSEFYFFITSISCELGECVCQGNSTALQSAVSSFYFPIRHHRLKAKTIFLLLSQVTNADQSVLRCRNISNLDCIGIAELEFSVRKACVINPQKSWIYSILRILKKRFKLFFIFFHVLMLVQ